MNTLRTLERAVHLGPGDHASWAYDDRAGLRAACVEYLDEGVRRGERLVYAADRPHDVLVDDLAGLPARDTLLEEGRLTVHTVEDLYRRTRPFDPRAQVDLFRQQAAAALAEGYAGLRVVGDVTDLVLDPVLSDCLVSYELAADAMYASTAATALCAVDRTRVGDRWRRVNALHRIQHPVDQSTAFALVLSEDTLRLVGEVDIACTDDLGQLLRCLAVATSGPLTITLPDLDFIDVAGTRVLAAFQRAMAGAGRTVRFTRLSAAARRTFPSFGLTEEPAS